jgi:hypothetical protein
MTAVPRRENHPGRKIASKQPVIKPGHLAVIQPNGATELHYDPQAAALHAKNTGGRVWKGI